MSEWVRHAQRTLEGAGHRQSAPRAAVLGALDELGCSVTAQEIADRLRTRGEGVGVASIYRALQLFDELRLVRRVDAGEAVARYEPVHPDGEHHHHLLCEACGKVRPFEDAELERAIERLAGRVDYTVDAHEVTLRGRCPACLVRG